MAAAPGVTTSLCSLMHFTLAGCPQVRNGVSYGVTASSTPVNVDFGRVMQRMRQLRAEISHVDSAARFRDLGIDVYQVSVTSAPCGPCTHVDVHVQDTRGRGNMGSVCCEFLP